MIAGPSARMQRSAKRAPLVQPLRRARAHDVERFARFVGGTSRPLSPRRVCPTCRLMRTSSIVRRAAPRALPARPRRATPRGPAARPSCRSSATPATTNARAALSIDEIRARRPFAVDDREQRRSVERAHRRRESPPAARARRSAAGSSVQRRMPRAIELHDVGRCRRPRSRPGRSPSARPPPPRRPVRASASASSIEWRSSATPTT